MSTRLVLQGTGIVSRCGRGWACQGVPDGGPVDASVPPHVYRVAPAILSDKVALKKLRRADRFSKLAALSAWDAVLAAGFPVGMESAELGIIVTTAFGPHQTTFGFLDEVLDFGDAGVSPTRFSHSVHNAAAAYTAMMLGSRGPTSTIADFERPLYAGALLASVWLREGRCGKVLVTYTEESSVPMEYIAANWKGTERTIFCQPLHFSEDPASLLSEGSVSLVLAQSDCSGKVVDLEGLAEVRDSVGLRQFVGEG